TPHSQLSHSNSGVGCRDNRWSATGQRLAAPKTYEDPFVGGRHAARPCEGVLPEGSVIAQAGRGRRHLRCDISIAAEPQTSTSSPRNWLSVIEEAAAWPAIGQVGSPEDASRAVGYGPTTGAAHVGGHPAWVDGVDEDAVGSQFGGEHPGERVQGCLRGAVARCSGTHLSQ